MYSLTNLKLVNKMNKLINFQYDRCLESSINIQCSKRYYGITYDYRLLPIFQIKTPNTGKQH